MAHLLGPLLFHHPVGVGCWACVCMVLWLHIIFSITLHFFLWKPIMILWQILYKILHLLIRCVQDNNNILSLKSWECCWSECYLFFPLSSLSAFNFTKLGSWQFHGWWKPWLHQSAEFPQLWHFTLTSSSFASFNNLVPFENFFCPWFLDLWEKLGVKKDWLYVDMTNVQQEVRNSWKRAFWILFPSHPASPYAGHHNLVKLCVCMCTCTRIPLWSTIKLATAAWLVLPQFRGATIIYEHYVRPYFYKSAANVVDKKQQLTDSQRKFLSSMSPQARASVADFIDNNGLDAFDKIIAAVNLPTQKNKKQASWISVFFILEIGNLHTYKNPCTWRLQFVQELLTWLHMSIVAGKCWVHKAPSRS